MIDTQQNLLSATTADPSMAETVGVGTLWLLGSLAFQMEKRSDQ